MNTPTHNSPVLTRYLPKTKIRKERNLLQDNVEGADGQQEPEVRSGHLPSACSNMADRSQTRLCPSGIRFVLSSTLDHKAHYFRT